MTTHQSNTQPQHTIYNSKRTSHVFVSRESTDPFHPLSRPISTIPATHGTQDFANLSHLQTINQMLQRQAHALLAHLYFFLEPVTEKASLSQLQLTMNPRILIVLVLVLVLFTKTLSLETDPKPTSNITVMGTVFCDACSNNTFSEHSYFLRGIEKGTHV